jgi:hypothetical protein
MNQESTPTENSGLSLVQKVLIGLGGVLLVLLIVVGYAVLNFVKQTQVDDDYMSRQTAMNQQVEEMLVVEEVIEENSIEKVQIDEYPDMFAPGELTVDWHVGAIPVSAEDGESIMKVVDPLYKKALSKERLFGFEGDHPVVFFETGVIKTPEKFAGEKLYQMFVPVLGMGLGHSQVLVTQMKEEHTFLVFRMDEYHFEDSLVNLGWFFGETTYDFGNVYTYPSSIDIKDKGIQLSHTTSYKKSSGVGYVTFASSIQENRGGIYDVEKQLIASKNGEDTIVHTDPEYGPVFFDGQKYYIVLADGAIHWYDISPDFFVPWNGEDKLMYRPGKKTNISWNAEVYNSDDDFVFGGKIGPFGCGNNFVPLTSIVNDEEWFDKTLLAQIGETAAGDAVYEMSDKQTNIYYKKLFDYGFSSSVYFDTEGTLKEKEAKRTVVNQMSDTEKFNTFLADNAIFFWQDPVGDWRVFHKARYQPMAECGKPVIYLYPEETTEVNVQVVPNGGFTVTDPIYPKGGWDVVAHTDGTLEYPLDGKTYPYLFWEGHASGFGFPEEGFVFAKEDVPTEMRALLYKTGLNKQETEDFMEFWEEKMIVKPYVFVTFTTQKAFDQAAPLSIMPRPDTTIRVFMNFELLDEWKEVTPLSIRTPKRSGYTAVEWGGVLR